MTHNQDKKLTMEAVHKLNTFCGRGQEDETAGEFLEALKKLATEAGLEESGGWYEVHIVSRFVAGVKYPAIQDKLRVMENMPSLEELGNMCKDTRSVFDGLSQRNIDHVYEKIFFSLDDKSFKNCLKVCQDWRTIIERIKPAKPVNGFMIFVKEMMKSPATGLTNQDYFRRSLLRSWQRCSHEDQAKYEERAQDMRQCYIQMYPHWNARGNCSPKKRKREEEGDNGTQKCRAREDTQCCREFHGSDIT